MYNISERYKIQWIAPERTGSRKVSEILTYFDFKTNGNLVYIAGKYSYSHMFHPLEEFKILCSTRNPYSRVLSIFKSFYFAPDKNFEKFVIYEIPAGNFLEIVQNPMMVKKPDYKIRLENFSEDVKNLPFINERLSSTQIDSLCSHGKTIDPWEDLYTQEMKEVIQKYCSHQFEFWGYEK